MTNASELKPCPFCGSEAKLEKGMHGEIFAACTRKGCVSFGGRWTTDAKSATDDWNTRPAMPEIQRKAFEAGMKFRSDTEQGFAAFLEEKKMVERSERLHNEILPKLWDLVTNSVTPEDVVAVFNLIEEIAAHADPTSDNESRE